MKNDIEQLNELRIKLIEAEDFIKKTDNVNERLSNYIMFLIAKHEILLENVNSENKQVEQIPLISL